MLRLEIADLFCGAGDTSQGATTATRRLGYLPIVTAINHWDVAAASHKLNHPDMVSLCESIDNLNPRQIGNAVPCGLSEALVYAAMDQ
jgi:DNA (cytosine-5)-methyltransferase 1